LFDQFLAGKYNLPIVGAAHGVPFDYKRPVLRRNRLKTPVLNEYVAEYQANSA
jgi:hypothetical protein